VNWSNQSEHGHLQQLPTNTKQATYISKHHPRLITHCYANKEVIPAGPRVLAKEAG
jgi:hypothetical protein